MDTLSLLGRMRETPAQRAAFERRVDAWRRSASRACLAAACAEEDGAADQQQCGVRYGSTAGSAKYGADGPFGVRRADSGARRRDASLLAVEQRRARAHRNGDDGDDSARADGAETAETERAEARVLRAALEQRNRRAGARRGAGIQVMRAGEHRDARDDDADEAVAQAPPRGETASLSRRLCAAARQRGNEAFRDGRYSVAVQHYSDALDHDAHCAYALSNRAQAYLRLANVGGRDGLRARARYEQHACGTNDDGVGDDGDDGDDDGEAAEQIVSWLRAAMADAHTACTLLAGPEPSDAAVAGLEARSPRYRQPPRAPHNDDAGGGGEEGEEAEEEEERARREKLFVKSALRKATAAMALSEWRACHAAAQRCLAVEAGNTRAKRLRSAAAEAMERVARE